MAAYWLQSLATLAADKQEAKGRERAAALFFSGIAPCQWKRDTAGQRVTTAALNAALTPADTPLEVDTKIANALLGLATKAFVAAQLASRDASVTALQGAKADATLLASYATNAELSASKTALQSALDAILAELAALQLSGSGGVVNAPAWAGFTTRSRKQRRSPHLEAPLSLLRWPTATTR